MQSYKKMEYDKPFFEKVFSTQRMEKYFKLYPGDEPRAILHYRCNLELAEAFYTSLSVLELTLRNALCRELETMTGREDWYAIFPTTPGLTRLNYYIVQATRQISGRHESITPSKIVAELTLGFWVSLLNSEYERLLWKDLRRAFPFMPKKDRQRKNVSAPLNPNRSLDIGEIACLCHAACFSASRRRSGLRRGVARSRMRTEAGKMPESLIFPIGNGHGVSNDRFGLNTIRTFRNRVFHNEPICWNLDRVEEIHRKMTTAMSWINKDVPGWLNQIDRFGAVCENIRLAMGWKE